jgi:hypothetical protein
MTNLLNLPQIPAGDTITIAGNASWNDQYFVPQPGFPAAPATITATLSTSSATITGASSTTGLVAGMLAVGYGIPPGTTIVSFPGSGQITLSNEPTAAVTGGEITFYPPPLDLTGITFTSMLRLSATDPTVLLKMSTTNGMMVNGGPSGQFGWQVAPNQLPDWPAQLAVQGSLSCVVDIEATDSTGAVVNLCTANGPIPVTVLLPVTR